MITVLTILGTRPEIIRLSRVLDRLDAHAHIRHVVVHTGQNYDFELNAIFFEEMQVRKPDCFLGIDTGSLGSALGDILRKSEEVLLNEQPDALLILGDTNSALAAIIARRMGIPIYHMEAGNRSHDINVPEETNRKIVDHIADFNLVYTERARDHLITEGLPHRNIYITGSPMFEVLAHYKKNIESSNVLSELGLSAGKYFVVSCHREENVDYPENLKSLMQSLSDLYKKYELPIVISTHPRTRKRLAELGYDVDAIKGCHFHKPFGFFDYCALQKAAFCVLSDSGTISEESYILQFPAVTIRNSMERPEALDYGSVMISGLESASVLAAIHTQTIQPGRFDGPPEYRIENTSERVVKLIVGTCKLAASWSGRLPKGR